MGLQEGNKEGFYFAFLLPVCLINGRDPVTLKKIVCQSGKNMAQKTFIALLLLLADLLCLLGQKIVFKRCFGDGQYCFSLISNLEKNESSLLEGQKRCKNIKSSLAEIKDNMSQNYMIDFINSAASALTNLSDRSIIVNAQRHDNDTWSWVNGDTTEGLNIRNGSNGYPYVYGCLQPSSNNSIDKDDIQAAAVDTKSDGYICQTRNCTVKVYCAKNDSQTTTWYEARNRCLNLSGDLASFDFTNNSDFISLNLSLQIKKTYWIGLKKSFWFWIDSGQEINYTSWKDTAGFNNSSSQCISVDTTRKSNSTGKWIATECNSSKHYLCLTNKNKTKRTSSNQTTIPTSNSPVSKADNNRSLALGLGIGLGGTAIVLWIATAIFLLVKRRGKTSLERKDNKETGSSQMSEYATVKIRQDHTYDAEEMSSTKTPIYVTVTPETFSNQSASSIEQETPTAVYDL